MFQVSADGGETWAQPERVATGFNFYRMIKLADGTLLLPYTDRQNPEQPRTTGRLYVQLGRWRARPQRP